MIEKMKFLSITGPKADIDRVVDKYLSQYEIHLENALSELSEVAELSPFMESNPYKNALSFISEIYGELDKPLPSEAEKMSTAMALGTVRAIESEARTLKDELQELQKQHAAVAERLKIIRPFRDINYNISDILKFQHIRFRFGRIEKQYYTKFEKYISDSMDTLFIKCQEDDEYVYGVYFAPGHLAKKVHAAYSSMHFVHIYVPDDYNGTATEAFTKLNNTHKELHAAMEKNKAAYQKLLIDRRKDIISAKAALEEHARTFDIRKLAACTRGKQDDVYYILCGWMTESDAAAFQNTIKNDDRVICVTGDDGLETEKKPPTKLKNRGLLKPFELYVKMYGLPAYGEMDPTWFLAITYSFIFGAMFGDVGQGLLLLFGGLFLYKTKKMDLAGIISCAGFFSTIFGFMFGSIFGFEDIIPAIWLRPMTAMTTVPMIGTLNTVFVVAIGFGMLLVLFCMILNIVNSIRTHDTGKAWFDTNGVAGFVFYGFIVLAAGLFISGHKLPGAIILVIMFGVPVILMFLKEPLTNLVEKKAKIMPEQKGLFFVQSFFEMFEVMLSFLSNTLSFLRIGAFAVSHAAMMEVVLMLAGAANGGSPNWIVIVLGNLFVCAMEGLIVGIQVLRLEYYELFSRFYKGGGREFRPFLKKATGH